MTPLALFFYLVAGCIVVATVLPIWQTNLWWVRLCDFPRYQIAALALSVLILMPLHAGASHSSRASFVRRRRARGTVANFVDMALFARRPIGGAKQRLLARCT